MAQEIQTFYSVFTSKVLKKKKKSSNDFCVTEYLEERQQGLKAGPAWASVVYI